MLFRLGDHGLGVVRIGEQKLDFALLLVGEATPPFLRSVVPLGLLSLSLRRPQRFHDGGRNGIALEFLAASPRQIEGGAIRQPEVFRRLLEFDVGALPQTLPCAPALLFVQRPFLASPKADPEVVDLLKDAELLRVGVGARGAPLVLLEGAPSGLDGAQRTLMENDPLEFAPLILRKRVVVLLLQFADLVELALVHCASGIEFLPGAGADGLAPLASVGEELAQLLLRAEREAQPFSVLPRLRRLLLVLAAARLAVGLEAAPLVQVEEGAAQFVRLERLAGDGALPQRVGVAARQLLALFHVCGHQAERDERAQQFAPARQVAVAASALATRKAAALGERLAFLRRAPVGEDAAAHSDDAARVAVRVKRDRRPPDGVRADVQPQPVRDFRFDHSRSSPLRRQIAGCSITVADGLMAVQPMGDRGTFSVNKPHGANLRAGMYMPARCRSFSGAARTVRREAFEQTLRAKLRPTSAAME